MTKKHPKINLHLNNVTSGTIHRPNKCIEINAEGANVPTFIMVIPAGHVAGRDGRWWNNDNPKNIIKAFIDGGVDLPMDYEHGSEQWNSGDGVSASGWIKSLSIVDGAVWASVEWTAKAAAMIAAKEYRYISPAFYDHDNSITSLSSIALVQHPNLAAIPALNNKNSNINDKHLTKGDEMDKEERIKLCRMLGLKDEASDSAILNAVEKQRDENKASLNKLNQAPNAKEYVPISEYEAVKAELNSLNATAKDAAEKTKNDEIETLVGDAVKDGKIQPSSKDYYLNACKAENGIEEFKSFIADAPSMNKSNGGGAKPPEGKKAELNATDKEVCAALNVTSEQFSDTE